MGRLLFYKARDSVWDAAARLHECTQGPSFCGGPVQAEAGCAMPGRRMRRSADKADQAEAPLQAGRLGAGMIVGNVGAGATKTDPIVVGKPNEFMLRNIAETFGLEREQICMVGDRLDTDILFGQNGGLTTMLVLSGVARAPMLPTLWLSLGLGRHAKQCTTASGSVVST